MRSHRSSSSGAGGLWLVRMALHPISLSISICRSRARRLMAVPRAPRSWWSHTPWRLTRSPLSKKPFSGSNWIVRMPKVVS